MNTSTHDPIAGLSADAFSSLFQAVGGLRNQRALLAMAACLALGVLVGGIAAVSIAQLGAFGALLAGLVFFVAASTGINAAGVLHMDQARGQPPRGVADALVYGLLCIPKLIVLGLGFLAIPLVLGLGLMPTIGLSASILGFGSFMGGGMMGGGAGSHAIAGAIGGGLLWALAATLVSQVWLLGLSLVFLRVSEGLDSADAQRALS